MTLGTVTGWTSIALIVCAAGVPLVTRIILGKRPPPESKPTRTHVLLGMAVSIICFLHTGVVLPMVGAPGAAAGGMLAMIPACIGFGLLVAHAGLGLQLRRPKLGGRARKRRMHTVTAILIFISASIHIAAIVTSP